MSKMTFDEELDYLTKLNENGMLNEKGKDKLIDVHIAYSRRKT